MKKIIVAAFAILMTATAWAESKCPQLYPNNQEVAIKNTIEICNSFYVVRYDVEHQAVIATFEVIQNNKANVARKDHFRPDPRVPERYRVRVKDYLNSHYDKGHMVAAEDAANADQMDETYYMTNMTPQEPTVNRISWRVLESKVRNMADQDGAPLKVGTFAIYYHPQKIKGGTPIPQGYWKVAYRKSGPLFFYAENSVRAPVQKKGPMTMNALTTPQW